MATTNYSWVLPTVGGSEDAWGTELNTVLTAIDTLLGGTDATEFAILNGATVTPAELNLLDGVTWTLTDLNSLTATVTELNYVDGVTSDIQTQIDAKSPLASPTFTGTPAAPTAATTTDTTQIATTAFVRQELDASSIGTMYESSEQTYAHAGTVTVAHGLSSIPKLLQVVAVCKTAQSPYSVGDELAMGQGYEAHSGTGHFGIHSHMDATNITTYVGTDGLYALNASGAPMILTAGSWRLVFRAWV